MGGQNTLRPSVKIQLGESPHGLAGLSLVGWELLGGWPGASLFTLTETAASFLLFRLLHARGSASARAQVAEPEGD